MDWSEWSECSKTCGTGSQRRTRSISQGQSGNGTACPPLEEMRNCTENSTCPVDCVQGPWYATSLQCFDQFRNFVVILIHDDVMKLTLARSEWSQCSVQCAGGDRFRVRNVTVPPQNGGNCDDLSETEECNTDPCRSSLEFSLLFLPDFRSRNSFVPLVWSSA